MSSAALELLKLFGAFVGAVIGALGAVSYKEYVDRKRSKERQQQTRWLPRGISMNCICWIQMPNPSIIFGK